MQTPKLPFSARLAADALHRGLDLSEPHGTVIGQFAAALQAAYDRGKADNDSEVHAALRKILNNWDNLHPKDRQQARIALGLSPI